MRARRSAFLIPALTGCVLGAALVSSVLGQGSGSSRIGQPGNRQSPLRYRQPYSLPAQAQPSRPRPATTEEFARSLWAFLVRPPSPYTRWPSLVGKEGMRTVPRPHGPSVRLYANAAAVGDPMGLPPGTILVLEDYAADGKARTGINILYRVKGYDPRNGDWYWMKYLENGTLVRTLPAEGGVPLAGRVSSCIECHRKAGGGDFVFSNDPPDTTADGARRGPETRGNDARE